MCEKASPSVGAILVVTKLQRDDWREELCKHFTPDSSVVNAYLKSPIGSFIIEKIIFTMDEISLKKFYDSWIRGKLEELVLHSQGKYKLR